MSKTVSIEILLSRATKASKTGNWISAVENVQAVLHRFPNNKRAKDRLKSFPGDALRQVLSIAKNHESALELALAERAYSAAFALSPQNIQIGLLLAGVQLKMGRAPRAIDTVSIILAGDANCVEALNLKGRALREMGRSEDAKNCFLLALSIDETNVQAFNNLGISARSEGDNVAAKSHYLHAIQLDPTNVTLHRNLSQVTRYNSLDAHISQMLSLLATSRTNSDQMAQLHFALFKALNDVGRTSEAFYHLVSGNRLAKTTSQYNFQNDVIPFALSKRIFDKPIVFEVSQSASVVPIFVTGLPRSGTTLVERILSCSENVQVCGELTVVQLAVSRLLKRVLDRKNKELSNRDVEILRDEILGALLEYSDGSPILVDKMPLNFRWIGYICMAIPEAKIVHMSRDPMAVAWSNYRLMFEGVGNGFSNDVEDIARFIVLHDNYLEHWRELFPDKILGVDYEQLVNDPENVTKSLATFCKLKWCPVWLAPEKSKGQVLTASADQVRKPIYRNSNDAWRVYESDLIPMSDALRSAGVLQ